MFRDGCEGRGDGDGRGWPRPSWTCSRGLRQRRPRWRPATRHKICNALLFILPEIHLNPHCIDLNPSSTNLLPNFQRAAASADCAMMPDCTSHCSASKCLNRHHRNRQTISFNTIFNYFLFDVHQMVCPGPFSKTKNINVIHYTG